VLARSLRAAFAPAPLAPDALDEIVEGSLSVEERAAAVALRDALDGKDVVSEEAQLAQALAAAWAPSPLADEDLRAIVARAVAAAEPAKVLAFRQRSTSVRVVRVAFGAAGVVALAASLVLVLRQTSLTGEAEAPLARARSTQELFTEPFKTGDASARIDRIAMARASDYRANRFAKWGVR
jgi:predicted dienelactone hydrolase